MTDAYDAITIGSGLGGLTAAALYARAGHRVLVLERNAEFGGAATTYRHGPLTVEASLHETADPLDPLDAKTRILGALGILDDLEFVPVGAFYEVRGRLFDPPFVLPHGFDAAEAALADRFPHQRSAFRRYFARLQAVRQAMSVVGEQHDSLWWFVHAPVLPLKLWPLLHDKGLSLSEAFDQLFGNDEGPKLALAANLGYYGDDPDRLWWLFYALAQGGYLASGGTYIRGGSGTLSRRLVGVVEAEGGAAHAGRTVTEIILDDQGRAAGVAHTAADGGDRVVDRARVLFANAAPSVLAEALPPQVRPAFAARYAGRRPSTSLFSIALGLSRPPRELGFTQYSTVLIPEWVNSLSDHARCAGLLADPPGTRMPAITLVDYSAIDSGLNPGGPHLVSVAGVDRLSNWDRLDGEAYRAKRDAWIDAIVAGIDRSFPGFAQAVQQREMATAVTMRHYLNTPDGATYGFAQDPPKGLPTLGSERGVATTVPGLWLASSYGGAGGFTGAMLTGMLAAQAAMKSQGRRAA
ncbi:NAD(P)/FAD-dependent oxidoreductase [Mycobacterium sp.]|uniref:phytoene desaturase family protein n=1 Tax=Mycobacterium sp. TaxID=1785 RepID=UPI002BD29D51|nr:NAD(P)/FAD-dependent oxidoreductase [Mycobacterium sp.]HTY31094.1 NAD(P)/FAD-dependent oxidoreductase [Mycobacterium sp.]